MGMVTRKERKERDGVKNSITTAHVKLTSKGHFRDESFQRILTNQTTSYNATPKINTQKLNYINVTKLN